jgi:hypothetical protein
MISFRPCRCDQFLPGRKYVEGRDCAKCWMFAHRPAVRKAWGGNPDECDVHYPIRRKMAASEVARVLSGPLVELPEDWKSWPVVHEAHRLLARQFLTHMPSYPLDKFQGRGAVICGGGAYEASTYVACQMLRHVGWEHPIQVWHRGEREPVSDRVRGLPGVEVVNSETHPARKDRRVFGGWESKSLAILHSPFEEVLFLDADCYPIFNPDQCFEPEHNPFGIVTWPDSPLGDDDIHWPSYGTTPDQQFGLNGGHYVFSKRQAWRVLQLASHYDNHSDYYYWRSVFNVQVGAFGDQEQIRVALHLLNTPSHRYTPRPILCEFNSYIQAGPHGRPLFVHRYGNKFSTQGMFHTPPIWHAGSLPMEATAWNYYLEWLTASTNKHLYPNEIPGWFTEAECRLWHRTCQNRKVLELGRHHGRSTTVAASSAKYVVSLDRESAHPADMWLQRYGVRHKVWLREGNFAELTRESGGPFSACLIDGAHDRANVTADINTVVPHMAPGSMIGFHDYDDLQHPDLKPAVDEAAQLYEWQLIDRADHLAVFRTPEAKSHS